MVNFNKPPFTGKEFDYMKDALSRGKISGDGFYTKQCEIQLSQITKSNVLLTTSCTHSLEMVALLEDFSNSDEILVPAFTFVSSALAYNKFGCKVKFVDVDPLSGMSSLRHYRTQVSSSTRAIVLVHYGGKISEDVEIIADFCKENNIILIEDAAQAVGVRLNGKHAGTFGDYGAISFHETKNITSGGEGGALIIANDISFEKAFTVRDKGTNRRAFFKGMVDKYSWRSKGSSYVMADLNAAYLFAQIENLDRINSFRRSAYEYYYQGLIELEQKNILKLVPLNGGNGHMFYILFPKRDELLVHLRSNNIEATFHYLPLNNSDYVEKSSHIFDTDIHTLGTYDISRQIIRLPLYFGITKICQDKVISAVKSYFQ